MLLFCFDVIEGWDDAVLKKLLDIVYGVMVKVFNVFVIDCYQIVYQYLFYEFIIEDIGFGFKRSKDFVIISIVSKVCIEY